MEDFLKVGKIVKPQGIKGQVKVLPLTDDVSRFKNLKTAFIDGAKYKISGAIIGDGVILTLVGISDRNAAELLRGKYVCVSREDAVTLKKDSYFIADLIGATVFADGNKIGVITDITPAKTDVFTVEDNNGGIMRFPFLKDLLIKVDIENGEVYLKQKRLSEVCVYEV